MKIDEITLIGLIADKAIETSIEIDKTTIMMDLIATHKHIKLDLGRMAKGNIGDIMHDIVGIYNNLDRTTGEMQNCFLPRFSA